MRYFNYSATHITCFKYTKFREISEYTKLNLENAFIDIIGRCDRERFIQDNENIRMCAEIKGIVFDTDVYGLFSTHNKFVPFISTRSPSILDLQECKRDSGTLDGKKITDYGFEKFCAELIEFGERLDDIFPGRPNWLSKEPIVFPLLTTLTEQEPVDHTEFHLKERDRKLTIE